MAATISKLLVNPKLNPLAAIHKKPYPIALADMVRLRYDDLYDPMYDHDVKEALNRLPKQVVDARNQRLKRALDLSMKHQYLPEDLKARQTPFRSYLQEMLTLINRERAEREALGGLPLYQRSFP